MSSEIGYISYPYPVLDSILFSYRETLGAKKTSSGANIVKSSEVKCEKYQLQKKEQEENYVVNCS